jgi:hypothetical protein
MYIQNYELDLPTTAHISFDCTSSSRFNLEFFNMGVNPLTSVEIEAVFTQGGSLRPWLNTLAHFDPSGIPGNLVLGIDDEANIYNLAPGETGIISIDCRSIYSLRVLVEAVSGKISIKGLGRK